MEKNIGNRITVVLDNLVYTEPNVNTMISNGRSEISGNFTV
ncbi:MAG: SecDF P1 head subdomain-containing protein [Flavobacteriales bacterium AspAUS03]